ncbi:P-loop NTPase [Metarhizium guizhouense ARSEF 977]|uniref:Mitochondrial division protein 1 n=1 Tax=Metarhizium guizhouense (strain ARSEF 977) TaxID=1276136 RepID=A0A0B4HQ11_METGA|nr:P-loop NTPase [Metarhizium guizhouense ARSEF 977]
MALEALGVASSVIAFEVNRLLREVNNLGETASSVQDLLDGPCGNRLKTSSKLFDAIEEARVHLSKLNDDLSPSSAQKAFRRLRIGALKWPLKSKDVEKAVKQLGRCGQNISLALQVDQTSVLLSLDQKSVLSRLPIAAGATYDSFSEEGNPTCMENTRVSLLDSITQWVDDPYAESIFWLNGMAGTGKSTIARTVSRILARTSCLGASFFFKRGEADRDNLRRLFTTVAAQLATRLPDSATHMKDAIDADPTIFQKAMLEQVDKLILQPLSKIVPTSLKSSTLVILIDALDECGGSYDDIRRVIHILSRTSTLKTLRVRVFVTSRPELPIRIGFSLVNILYRNVALQEMPEYVIQHDISMFLEHQLAKIRGEYNVTVSEDRRLPLTWPGHETVQALVRMATPLFIFAATVCRFLADLRWHPDDPLIEGLDKVEKVELLQQFRAIVGSIIILARPLSVLSLERILCIPKRYIEHKLDGLYSVLSVPKVWDAPVRLLHLSFRDFLLDPDKKDDNPFWVNESTAHDTMASNCFRLMDDSLRKNICNLKDPAALQSSIDPERVNECIPDDVQFVDWIEALSLMGRVRETIGMMKALKGLLAAQNSEELSDLIGDAYRFLLANMGTISSYPLQLYSSALLFSPKESSTRNLFYNSIPQWIRSWPDTQSRWGSCLQILEGHTNSVKTAKFAPVSARMVSASADRTVRIWDTNTGECLQVIHNPVGVSSAMFSHDERLVVAACYDGIIRLWDVDTEECVQELRGHSGKVSSAVFSSDSKLVVSASFDKTARIWDSLTGKCTMELRGHDQEVSSVSISRDSTRVLTSSFDSSVRIWSTVDGKQIGKLETNYCSYVCAISNDGSMAGAGLGGGCVELWCLKSSELKMNLREHADRVWGATFSQDDSLIATCEESSTVNIWSTATGEPIQIFYGHQSAALGVDFSPDSSMVASASRDDTVCLWSVGDYRVQVIDSTTNFYIPPNGKYLISQSYRDDMVVWDIATQKRIHTIENGCCLLDPIVFSSDSTRVATQSGGSVQIWDVNKGELISEFSSNIGRVTSLAFSKDGQYLVCGSETLGVEFWHLGKEESVRLRLQSLPHRDSIRRGKVSVSPDMKYIAFGHENALEIWSFPLQSPLQMISKPFPSGFYFEIAQFSPDGRLLAVAFTGGAYIYDTTSWG